MCTVVCRHEMYPGYKGQRPPTPEAITEAVKQLRDLIRVMGIREIIVPGIEADDVIGTVANNALEEGLQVAIASPDKVSIFIVHVGMQSNLQHLPMQFTGVLGHAHTG